MATFETKVKEIVANIPRGRTMTYAEVADKAGSPKGARAVANIMAGNFDQKIPCHRVIRKDGQPGGYNRGGPAVKKALLQSEGVVI